MQVADFTDNILLAQGVSHIRVLRLDDSQWPGRGARLLDTNYEISLFDLLGGLQLNGKHRHETPRIQTRVIDLFACIG